MVQLRLKAVDARTLVDAGVALLDALRDAPTVPLIVNDRVDVALACGAAGVHVGVDDLPVRSVRRITPPGFIIGASVGDESEVANGVEADYVGIGPVYATLSKSDAGQPIGPDGLRRLRERCRRPCVAIGGMTAENAATAIAAGADGVAVIRSVFGARSPERAARELWLATER